MVRWLRNVHLLLGLLALPFLLMYGASAVRLAHGSWFSQKAKHTEREVEVGHFDANSGRELARVLMEQHGVHGELSSVVPIEAGFNLEIERPGHSSQIEYSRYSGRAKIRTSTFDFMRMLTGIHLTAGFSHSYQIHNIWAVFVVVVSIALILQGLTGIYLWFHFHKERKIGVILLSVNLRLQLWPDCANTACMKDIENKDKLVWMSVLALTAGAPLVGKAGWETSEQRGIENLLTGKLRWSSSPPLLEPVDADGDQYYSVKDPSVVRYDGRWHVFFTIRGKKRSHQIGTVSFTSWEEANKAPRHTLRISDGYFCAPQVFYFKPHQRWYLIYQVIDESRKPSLQPAFSTARDLSDPASWSPPKLLFADELKGIEMWIDFWVICDEKRAHLFWTDLKGKMFRADTDLKDFPNGWSAPRVALEGDIYEASHTYKLRGSKKYLTIIEARAPDERRYYKAYLADRLDGDWVPLAATHDQAFAAPSNVRFLR